MIDEQKLRELGNQFICHPASRHITEIEEGGEAILAMLDELATLRSERTAWRVTAENAEALVADLRKQNEAQKDEWLSWAAKRDGLEKDAERYQQVRRGQHWSVINGIGDILRGDDLDVAIESMKGKTP